MTTPLRDDFDASGLRLLARGSKDAGQARRLLALAAIYEGAKRHEAAKIGGADFGSGWSSSTHAVRPV